MKSIFFVVFSVMVFPLIAQEALPRYLTAQERIEMEHYIPPQPENTTPPPSFSVRNMAEWEEVEYTVIAWTSFPNIQVQIVDAAQEESTVIINCSDSNQVKSYLQSQGVGLHNIIYNIAPFNSIWIRDYFANTVYKDDVDSLYLVDWIYNRPRPQDDVLPASVANLTGYSLFTMTQAPNDLVNTGGNYMSDGMGNAFSSDLVDEENGPMGSFNQTVRTPAQVDQVMNDYLNVDPYIKMTQLPFDIISHIDMHMKLLDEERLLVGEFPLGQSDGPQLEANIQYVLNNFQTEYGRDFQIERIPMPPSASGNYPPNAHYRTFTNSIFINKTVLLPVYGQALDNQAIARYQELLPGYNIVPINCSSIIPLAGAIHCITHTIGVADPLLIQHRAQRDTIVFPTGSGMNNFNITATIKHRSGIQAATLYYSLDSGSTFQSLQMSALGQDRYGAVIPVIANPAITREVQYYIEAQSVSGKQISRPMTADQGGHFAFEIVYGIGLEEESLLETNIFPNPASAITCIPLSNPITTSTVVTVRNSEGKILERLHDGVIEPRGKVFWDASYYPSGTYYIQIQHQEGITESYPVQVVH